MGALYSNRFQRSPRRCQPRFVTEDELLPLKSLSFGEFTVPVPADSEAYLNRMYVGPTEFRDPSCCLG